MGGGAKWSRGEGRSHQNDQMIKIRGGRGKGGLINGIISLSLVFSLWALCFSPRRVSPRVMEDGAGGECEQFMRACQELLSRRLHKHR